MTTTAILVTTFSGPGKPLAVKQVTLKLSAKEIGA